MTHDKWHMICDIFVCLNFLIISANIHPHTSRDSVSKVSKSFFLMLLLKTIDDWQPVKGDKKLKSTASLFLYKSNFCYIWDFFIQFRRFWLTFMKCINLSYKKFCLYVKMCFETFSIRTQNPLIGSSQRDTHLLDFFKIYFTFELKHLTNVFWAPIFHPISTAES